jgi:hypothetical protein
MYKEAYLGDGLYANFDGNTFILKANSNDNPTDIVYLDPQVLGSFQAFIKFCYMRDEEEAED